MKPFVHTLTDEFMILEKNIAHKNLFFILKYEYG